MTAVSELSELIPTCVTSTHYYDDSLAFVERLWDSFSLRLRDYFIINDLDSDYTLSSILAFSYYNLSYALKFEFFRKLSYLMEAEGVSWNIDEEYLVH